MKLSDLFAGIDDRIKTELDALDTIKDCEKLAKIVFDLIAEQYGTIEARRIFSLYAKPLTKRDKTMDRNVSLLLRFLGMKPRRSATRLARQLAKEAGERTKKDGVNPAQKYKKRIERLYRDPDFKNVRDYIEKTLND
jgi:hypothetical protein